MRTALASAALASAGLVGAPAQAADATFTDVGPGLYDTVQGHTNGNPDETFYFVGTLHISIDGGPATDAYCVDINLPISIGDSEPQVTPDYPCEVVFILNHAFPNPSGIPTPLADTSREAAAVQAAIWHYTDDFTVTAPADVVTRAGEIVAAAATECETVPAVPQSLTVSPETAVNYLPAETTHVVTATLLDTNGQPMAGYPLDVVVTGAAGPQTMHGATDPAGVLAVSYDNTFAVTGTDTITATASFTVPVGLEFKLEGKQGIALAGAPRPGTVTGTASKRWVPAACGDGVVNQPGETCDDGNQTDGDGCDANCTPTACGNGIATAGEACDDGNLVDGDGCDANCTPTACGNGIATAGEACDDGNLADGDGCDTNCTPPRCGNGIADTGELCDDGNTTNGDACSANCRFEEACNDMADNDGNGFVDCEDPRCTECLTIIDDPAVITWSAKRPDRFTLHGTIEPATQCNPAVEGMGVLVTNANGIVYKATLGPGDMTERLHGWYFLDRAARRGEGTHGGLFRVKIRERREGRYFVTLEAYGDLSAATLPTMMVELVFGNDVFMSKGTWKQTRLGWKLDF